MKQAKGACLGHEQENLHLLHKVGCGSGSYIIRLDLLWL